MQAELELLRGVYGDVQHAEQGGEDWFQLPNYPLPPGWLLGDQPADCCPLAFLVKADYPGAAPYGFLLPKAITFGGRAPDNTGDPPKPVPFPGDWLHFSWTVDQWQAGGDACKGSNLVSWCRSFATRLKEGV